MDVTKLWMELFPKHATRVTDAWTRMEPAWPSLREFRDRAGFHADKPFKYFGARNKIRSESAQLDAALKEFETLLKFFLKAEAKELPELEAAVDCLLDDLEKTHKTAYQRAQFKAYLMIPNTDNSTTPTK